MERTETLQTSDKEPQMIFPIQFVQVGELSLVPAPLVRVSTCGGMTIAVLQEVVGTDPPSGRYAVVTPQQRRKGSTTARNLLGALASLPGHYASKDWLMEKLGPSKEEDEETWGGLVRVDNIVTLLRGLLCPPGIPGEQILRKALVSFVHNRFESGPGYQLATEPLLWLDVDAIEIRVKQACSLEQKGKDALLCWEQAYALASKGTYLPDERYSDWAQHKRTEVEGYLRQAVHTLHRLYLTHDGEAGEEQVFLILRTYWQTHPTDEDVLRPLLELLGKRGCFQEAEMYYHCLCQQLETEGRVPNQRTQQTLQKVRVRSGRPVILHPQTVAVLPQEPIPFSLSTEQAMLLFSLSRGDETMDFDPSKREMLRSIAAAFLAAYHTPAMRPSVTANLEPWEQLFMAQQASSPATILTATTLEHFQHLLTISWQLCNENQFVTAEGVLESFLPQLLSLPRLEPDVALLASRGLYLQSMLAHHQVRLNEKVRLCQLSMSYAREAGDANALVSALIELALAYEYRKQSGKRLIVLQEALDQCGQASPLIQSLTYWEYAAALAENKRVREAQWHLGLAEEAFPDDPMKDPGYAFADGNIFTFSYRAGLVHIHTGSIPQAFSAFEHYKQHRSGSTIPERLRLLIANGQSRAAILANDAERYADLLEDVLAGSMRIGSQKRFDEAHALFQQEMPASWLSISRIRQLSEQYNWRREV